MLPLCFHDWPIRRPAGSVLPRRAQSRQKELDGLLCCCSAFGRLHICERGKAFLRRADVTQQHNGVETRVDLLKAGANFVGRVPKAKPGGITASNVKAFLLSVLDKTGCKRQLDLISSVSSLQYTFIPISLWSEWGFPTPLLDQKFRLRTMTALTSK
jgi:hypothetical protein